MLFVTLHFQKLNSLLNICMLQETLDVMMIKWVEGWIRPNDVRWLFLILLNNRSSPPQKKLKLSKNDIKFMKNQVEGPLLGI